jgi:BCD family chlorophyll transporter-like MFS transporter
MGLNLLALWKQEARNPSRTAHSDQPRPPFRDAWRAFTRDSDQRPLRFLVAVGLGTAGFSMQDILLEPYGGQILHLSVGATTLLTALLAAGTLAGFAVAARRLSQGADPQRLSALGVLVGVSAFSAVIFAAPLESILLFRTGTLLIGFGAGLFSVGTLIAAMELRSQDGSSGLALGAWGAVQASAAGVAIALSGALRDGISELATQGVLGPALASPATGYIFVYHVEIALLFATLVALGPLVRSAGTTLTRPSARFGLAEFPG